MKCPDCKGKGYIKSGAGHTFQTMLEDTEPCLTCEGAGVTTDMDFGNAKDDKDDKPSNSFFNRRDNLK